MSPAWADWLRTHRDEHEGYETTDDNCPYCRRGVGVFAPVSAVAGPEPDEGPTTLERLRTAWLTCSHAVGWCDTCMAAALAAPAVAPVGDEEAREAAAAVIRRARYQPAARADRTFDQHLADELHTAGLLAAPGDEGAARAAVAPWAFGDRSAALLLARLAWPFDTQIDQWADRLLTDRDLLDRTAATARERLASALGHLAAALSAVSGEHRDAEDGQ